MAPATYATAVRHPTASASNPATTMMNGTSTEYSRFRKAIAPDRIWWPRSRIVSFPGGCRFTYA